MRFRLRSMSRQRIMLAALLLGALRPLLSQENVPPAQRFAENEARLVQDARSMLGSDDLCSVAWGAWSVAKYQLAPCRADLRARLGTLVKDASAEKVFATLAILDALIQTHAFVPGEELAPFLGGHTLIPALVLLARRPAANRELLLGLFRAQGDRSLEWLACGNLLAREEDPDFVLELLRMPVLLEVEVVDDGSGDSGSHAFVTSMHPSPSKGYPPIWYYQLGHDGTRIADGTRPVCVERTRNTTDCRSIGSDEYRGVRREWLAKMLDRDAPPDLLEFEHRVEIKYSGSKEFVAAIQERRTAIERGHRELVAACVKAKLIAAPRVEGLVPTVDVRVVDCRDDASEPLPAITSKK
jgi:hypothetical protein